MLHRSAGNAQTLVHSVCPGAQSNFPAFHDEMRTRDPSDRGVMTLESGPPLRESAAGPHRARQATTVFAAGRPPRLGRRATCWEPQAKPRFRSDGVYSCETAIPTFTLGRG
jgi:hypothetical protein